MDQTTRSQRSKSFKALSMAQPIRKDIEHTLNKLEIEKRKFLANDREETLLKEEYDRKRKELNALKGKAPETVNDDKRTSQTHLKFRSADRTYEVTLNNIQKLKEQIDMSRKQMSKYKAVNEQLGSEQKQLTKDVEKLVQKIVEKENQNKMLKDEISNYRDMNIKNLSEFKKSHMNLTKSNFRDENERKKYAVSGRTFLGEEERQSRMVHHQYVSDVLKNSGLMTNEGKVDIMSESVPLAKNRVQDMIHKNKEKIKIAEDYQKFGEALGHMFEVMKEYKGRDDVDYLAKEFVTKQKQIQKLGQYIGKLEYRILSSNRELGSRMAKQQMLQKEMKQQNDNQIDTQYLDMNKHVSEEIDRLKKQQSSMTNWLKQIGDILCPLADDEDFSRGNAANVIGKIEEKLAIDHTDEQERMKQVSPIKQLPVPTIESQEHHGRYNELLNYDKMREYAEDYIKNKKTV